MSTFNQVENSVILDHIDLNHLYQCYLFDYFMTKICQGEPV